MEGGEGGQSGEDGQTGEDGGCWSGECPVSSLDPWSYTRPEGPCAPSLRPHHGRSARISESPTVRTRVRGRRRETGTHPCVLRAHGPSAAPRARTHPISCAKTGGMPGGLTNARRVRASGLQAHVPRTGQTVIAVYAYRIRRPVRAGRGRSVPPGIVHVARRDGAPAPRRRREDGLCEARSVRRASNGPLGCVVRGPCAVESGSHSPDGKASRLGTKLTRLTTGIVKPGTGNWRRDADR